MVQTNLTVRIDESIKHDAENLFDALGMSLSGAINVFFRQAVRERGIPFAIRDKPASERYAEYFNPRNMERLRESIEQAERGETISFTLAELKEMEAAPPPQRALDFIAQHPGDTAND